MSIVTYGDPTKEVEQYLGIGQPLPAEKTTLLAMIVEAAESIVKTAIRREFEETNYVQYFEKVESGQVHLLLKDRPVSTWTKIEEIGSWDANGDAADLTVVTRSEYYVDQVAGIVTKLSGSWTAGRFPYVATYVAGYSAAEITASTLKEIRLAKLLINSIVAREWGLSKLGQRHLRSISTGDESVSFQYDFDFLQLRLIDQLKRDIRFGV